MAGTSTGASDALLSEELSRLRMVVDDEGRPTHTEVVTVPDPQLVDPASGVLEDEDRSGLLSPTV